MRFKKTLLRLFALALLSAICFGGKSLVINPGVTNTNINNIPNFSNNQSWRIEFQIHGWVLPAPGNFSASIFSLTGLGVQAWIYPNNLVAIGDARDNINPSQPCQLDLTGRTNALVRIQRDASQMVQTCEIWNYDGTGYIRQNIGIVKFNTWPFSGASLAGSGTTNLGFLRIFTSLVPPGGRPPTTADGGDYLELKFDNNLNDSSGHGRSASISGATYVDTPNQVPIAFPKTFGAPTWNTWTSLRAGHPAQLDGSASYSLTDASSSVSYFWQQLSGPSTVAWKNRTAATPTITGLVFGTYTFQLTITDSGNNKAATTLQLGAVAYNDNGVVIPADPKVTQVYGPMIAFGQNPWGYEDERQKRMVELQNAYFISQKLNPPVWMVPGQGTVSYPFSGKGPGPGTSCTTLTSAITATSTSIAVANASCLSLAALPTVILIGSNFSAFGGTIQEMVRICSTTATSGPATLTVCYDGRGMASAPGINVNTPAAQAWPSGTMAGEYKIAGTGTKFITDANRPLCPAGAPGPPGAIAYFTGSVQLTPGSTSITGIGTNWTIPNGVAGGNNLMIRINATHGGGIPFVSVASITTVSSPTSITLSRAVPSDVDAGTNFTYAITKTRYVSLEATDSAGSTLRALQNMEWCESETAAFAIAAHDITAFDGMIFSGVHYSYKDSLGAQSAFGSNFYGSGLAARAFYFRSGWDFAKQTADIMDEQWINDPELCNGWCGGIPLLQGGGVVGALADLALNPTTKLTWPNVRQFGTNAASISSSGCNSDDTRDTGLYEGWIALLALFDPSPTVHTQWQSALTAFYNRDTVTVNPVTGSVGCKGKDNSWAHGFLWSPGAPGLNVTNGSVIVTAHNPGTFTPQLCNVATGGTATVRKGSPTILIQTGTLIFGSQIVVTGTMNGTSYTMWTAIQADSSSSGTLGGLWLGDSGPVSWLVTTNDGNGFNLTTIASSNNDPLLQKNWACTYNTSSQVTLHAPWTGPTDTTGHLSMYSSNLAGFGQQAFMLGGYKESALRWASLNPDPVLAAKFAALTPLAAKWVHDFGYDPQSQGMNYGRIYQACEPYIMTSTADLPWKGNDCQTGADPSAIRAARVLNSETTNAISIYYLSNLGPAALNYADTVYGSIWGFCPYTAKNFYCDGNYVRDENSDVSLGSFKWPGFFFGIGASHQWPAVRAGGLRPPRNRIVYLSLNLGSAASARVVLTAPTGTSNTVSCSASPCPVTVDDEQGQFLFTIQYLSGTGSVLSRSDPDILAGAP